jgi:hypothetical protein
LGEGLALGEDGKTLNVSGGGSQADWNQNDETAADYVKNRPGGYTQVTHGYEITWDGVVGDKVVVDGGDVLFVKVSDRVFTAEELIGATVTVVGDRSFTINNDNIQSYDGVIGVRSDVLVCTSPTTIEDITIPETGTYFMTTREEFTSSLSKPDSTTTIKIPAKLLQIDPTAFLINPAKYPTDDDPQPSSPIVILYTDEMIDESGVLRNPPTKYATGYVYVGSAWHKIVTINGESFPTSEWLVMALNRSGNTQYTILTKDEYADISLVVSSGGERTNVGAPVYLFGRDFMRPKTTSPTTPPYYNANLITGVVVAIDDSSPTGTMRVLAKKIQPYEKVEFKIVTTHGQANFTPITSSDEGEIIDLIAAIGGGIAGVAKCNQKNAWYARKFCVENFNGDNGTVRGHFLTGYGAYETVASSDLILSSTTSGSTKKFRITVDDSGTIKATEVTDN